MNCKSVKSGVGMFLHEKNRGENLFTLLTPSFSHSTRLSVSFFLLSRSR